MKKKRKSAHAYKLQKKTKNSEKPQTLKRIVNTFLVVFAAVVLGFGVTQFCVQTVYMTGPSMQDKLRDGDEMLLNKMAYRIGKVHRYDIIAIRKIGSDDYYDIKRVIGLPGDTVSVVGGRLVINGKQVDEKYPFAVINSPGLLSEDIVLEDGEYFCLGDNTSNSEDSRFINYGNVQKSEIKGKVFYIIQPEERRGKLTNGY